MYIDTLLAKTHTANERQFINVYTMIITNV